MVTMDQKRQELAPRQALFIEEMEKHGDATCAALKAGYNPRTAGAQAKKMLANKKIAGILQEYREHKGDTTPTDVRLRLMQIYDMCIKREPVIKWDKVREEWTPTGEEIFDAKHALRAIELLGESLGMFEKTAKGEEQGERLEDYLKRLGEEPPL